MMNYRTKHVKNILLYAIMISVVGLAIYLTLSSRNPQTGYLIKDLIRNYINPNVALNRLKDNMEMICSNYFVKKIPSQKGNEDVLMEFKNDPNNLIYKYVPKFGVDSYVIPLTVAALITQGDILELGVGKYSTLLLNRIVKEQNKFLFSIEMNPFELQKLSYLNESNQHLLIKHSSVCANTINPNKIWGMVFIDHSSVKTRYKDAIQYAHKADIVVAHDTENRGDTLYEYSKAIPFFKYHCKYSLYMNNGKYTSTSLLSNTNDFTFIKTILKQINTEFVHVACDQEFK